MPLTDPPKMTSARPPTAFDTYMKQRAAAGGSSGLSKITSQALSARAANAAGATNTPPPAIRQAITQGAPTATQSDYDYTNAQYGKWYTSMKNAGYTDNQIVQMPQFKNFQDQITGLAGQTTDHGIISKNIADETGRLSDPTFGGSAKAILGAFQARQTAIATPPTPPTPPAPQVSDISQFNPSSLTPAQQKAANDFLTQHVRDVQAAKFAGKTDIGAGQIGGAYGPNGTSVYNPNSINVDVNNPTWGLGGGSNQNFDLGYYQRQFPGLDTQGLLAAINGASAAPTTPSAPQTPSTRSTGTPAAQASAPADPNSAAGLPADVTPQPLAPSAPSASPYGPQLQKLLDQMPVGDARNSAPAALPAAGSYVPGHEGDPLYQYQSTQPQQISPGQSGYNDTPGPAGMTQAQAAAAAQQANTAASGGPQAKMEQQFTGQASASPSIGSTQPPISSSQSDTSKRDSTGLSEYDYMMGKRNPQPTISAQSTPTISGGLPSGQSGGGGLSKISSTPDDSVRPARVEN